MAFFSISQDNKSKVRRRAKLDLVLIFLVYAVALFGVFAVSAATFHVNSDVNANIFNQIFGSYYGLRQSIFVALSPIILGFIIALPYEFIHKNIWLVFGGSVVLLLVALIGEEIAGIQAFISIIWGFTIQPAEFAKIAIIIALARLLEDVKDPFVTLKSSIKFLAVAGTPALITIAQGEMGSAMVMAVIVVAMLFAAGMPWKRFVFLLLLAAAGMAALILFWTLVTPDSYRLQRILALVNPESASEATKYQVNNSIIAIGAGGLTGVGPFKEGSIVQLDYVPKDWTDFIFSAIGEIFGFIGSVIVIVVYTLIILRLLYLASVVPYKFSELIIVGTVAMFLTHMFLNIGMTIGIVPVVGIPLPFLSYGGSNLFTNMISIGLVLNVTRNVRLVNYRFDTRFLEGQLRK